MSLIPRFLLVLLLLGGTLRAADDVAARFFPVTGTLAANPYAQAALTKIPGILKATTGLTEPASEAAALQAMPKYTDLRKYADQTQILVWAYLCPGTPHTGSPELLARITARLDLLSCTMRGGSYFPLYPAKKDNHYNVFLLESFAYSALALTTAQPSGLPPASVERWKTMVREALVFQTDDLAGHESNGEYGIIPNIDLRYLNALESGSRLLGDAGAHAKAEALLAATRGHLLPDGAFHYFAGENECFCYHESNLRDLARFVQLTGSAEARSMIVASKAYYPLSIAPGGVIEYTTAPRWKAYWNGSGRTVGPQIVAFFANDPANRAIARAEEAKNPGFPEAYLSDLLIGMGCHEAAGAVQAPPDRVVQADANLGGFRTRYGRFAVNADARDHRSLVNPITGRNPARANLKDTSFGKASWIGATVSREGGASGALDAALLRVYGAVQFAPDKPLWLGAATFTSGLPGTTIIAGDRACVAGRSTMGSGRPGPTYVPFPGWDDLQAWVVVQDRLVGYLATEATAEGDIAGLSARIALGYGRTGADLVPKTIQPAGDNTWRYGDLVVRIVANTYGPVTVDPATPYFGEEAKIATELVLGDAAPASPRRQIATGTRREAVIEVYPAWSQADPSIALSQDDGLVTVSLGHGGTLLRFNTGKAERAVPVPAGYTAHGPASQLPPAQPALLIRTTP